MGFISQVLARTRFLSDTPSSRSDGPQVLIAAADSPRPAAPLTLSLSLSRFLAAKLQFSLRHSCSRSVERGQGGTSVAGERGWRARPRTLRPLPPWWRWPRATATARASEAAAPRAPTRSASAPLSSVPFPTEFRFHGLGFGRAIVWDGAMQGETVRRIESLFLAA